MTILYAIKDAPGGEICYPSICNDEDVSWARAASIWGLPIDRLKYHECKLVRVNVVEVTDGE